MTFSLLLTDGTSIVAITASCVPGVGRVVPHVRAGVGAALTQARGDARIGVAVLDRLAAGSPPEAAVDEAVEIAGDADHRQVAALTLDARSAIHRGPSVLAVAAEIVGRDRVACGNLLDGAGVLPALDAGVAHSEASAGLLYAAFAGMQAAEAAGGDVRGRMSAALRAHGPTLVAWGPGRPLDLDVRVDRAEQPLTALEEAAAAEVAYQVVGTYADGRAAPPPLGRVPEIVEELVARAPDASAAVHFCRAVVADVLGAAEEGERLARGVVARHPGPGATPVTVDRLWRRDGTAS